VNEQFSRLYHLAWNYAESDPEYQENPTYERRSVVQFRIFAELIVGECIDLISPYAVRMENFDGGHPITDLKKHFGIAE
jgi:hypothetical protein